VSLHDLSWAGVSYTRVPPGTYSVVGKTFQGPEWIRQYSRWSLRIEFVLLDDGQAVSRFFNMGSNPNGPHIGRHSLYFRWWTAANGEPPMRGQKMTTEVFFEGQVFTVKVEDAIVDGDRKTKHDGEVYSRVTELIEVSRPQSFNQESVNHKSLNQESCNHPIKQSTNQVASLAVIPQSFASAGRGNANPKPTPRAGTSVPAQASTQASVDIFELSPEEVVKLVHASIAEEELRRTAPMTTQQPQKRARSRAKTLNDVYDSF